MINIYSPLHRFMWAEKTPETLHFSFGKFARFYAIDLNLLYLHDQWPAWKS